MKFYILCEGERDKSEYKFIQRIIDEYHTNEDYELMSAGGNKNIQSYFDDKIESRLKDGDVFILIFDCVKSIGQVLVPDMLMGFKESCSSKGVLFRYTTYYCYEELFLTYDGLKDMLKVDETTLNEWQKVKNSIMSGKNYFNEGVSFWESRYNNRYSTREKASAGICSNLLRTITGNFSLLKECIGDCWVQDCSSIILNKNICGKCKYRCKGCVFKEKLNDLEKNSISNKSLPFSTIFDIGK